MKILNKQKIKESYLKYNLSKEWVRDKTSMLESGFRAGVSYTEKELSDLSIEFADWIDKCGYIKNDGIWKYWDNGIVEYTTKTLFQEFIKER